MIHCSLFLSLAKAAAYHVVMEEVRKKREHDRLKE